jgi:hypothetical protein
MVPRGGLVICGLLVMATAAAADTKANAGDESQLFGDWKGDSIVVAKNSAAKDEVVVWHIAQAREHGKVRVTADKIVNGKSITMGTGDWAFDKSNQTITWEIKGGVWKLTARGNTLKGTLTLTDGTVFRRVSLERAASDKRPAN